MKVATMILACIAVTGIVSVATADHIWINEFHYDNPGGDVGEFVEVGIRNPNGSGFGPSDYAIELYNGNGGALYETTGTLNTFGTISAALPIAGSTSTITLYSEAITGIQNGDPDGIALVNVTNNSVASFLCYEGSFTATAGNGGIAGNAGATCMDVGVSEPGTGDLTSLSAMGTGVGADQFNASSFALTEVQTPGGINTGQTFAVPEPTSIALLLLSCGGVGALLRKSS